MKLRVSAFSTGILLLAMALVFVRPESAVNLRSEAARVNNLGVAYMNQQLFEKALAQFKESSKIDPTLMIASLNQGIALLNLQQLDPAKELLLAAVQHDPKDPHAWYNLGLLHKNSGDAQGAVEAFERVTQIDANDADTWYMLGSAYAQLKQFPKAIDSFQKTLKLNPLHASGEFGLSRAYQQSGDTAQARQHLTRFQYITQNKLGGTMSLAYGEQGRYSRAEESDAAEERVSPAIKVRFVDVTSTAGVAVRAPQQHVKYAGESEGQGTCFFDYDGDGKLDLFLPSGGANGGIALLHNIGNGKFTDVTREAGLDPALRAVNCTTGDYDNDGAVDLAISTPAGVRLLHNEKNGKFKDVTEAAGIRVSAVLGLTFVDYDHDGDLDLFLTRASGAPASEPAKSDGESGAGSSMVMLRNNGNGTFTDVTDELGFTAHERSVGAVGTDYNNDRAIDLLVTGTVPKIFENPREGKFHLKEFWPTDLPASNGVAVLDFNHDGWMDIALTHNGAPGVTLWRNNQGKGFERVSLPAVDWVRGWGVAALDYDNDGWIDLAAVGEKKDGQGEIRLFRNLGADGFKDVTSEVGLDKIKLSSPRALITGDYDGDGATDLLVTQNQGAPVLLKNEGGNQNHWLRLSLKGLNDNKSAIGTKVEVFAGATRQKWEVAGSSSYLGQNSTEIVVGLGQSKDADVVRMLWPTGVLQDEIEVAGNRTQSYMELDRRGSSCPTLFVWNGKHYELVADVLGAGVLGHWVAPGERNIPRSSEYVKIDRDAIHLKNGMLSFRLMEPMEEVVYLDQVKLLAVDHPSDVEVYPNEYFASNPPYPPFRVITSRDARPPAGAWEDTGRNVLPDILAHRYFGDFDLLPFKGFTKMHSLELDLGDAYKGGPLRLLLHGEIEYFTATGMYAAAQAGIQATAPYIEAQGADRKWKRVIDDMGFPAGLPRVMTADLSGKLPLGTRRIRISTNLQIYWDNILVDRSSQDKTVRLTPVRLENAELAFHGYPRQIEDQPPGNVKYVYEDVSTTGPYAHQAGAYTRYGDVRSLLNEGDDRLTVFGSGDEVKLDFNPAALPALPKGWVRDYFFMAHGYEKDMDFYAAEGSTVAPLPFKSMSRYPYPTRESFPADDRHMQYLIEYNTRFMSGNEAAGYSYKYGSSK